MKKSVSLALIFLLVYGLFTSTNALAGVRELAKKVRHSVSSIRAISILSVVRGTVTLIAPKRLSALRDSLRSVYVGNDISPKRVKKIKVSGQNDGQVIRLEGKGRVGEGYSFNFPSPESINEFARSSRFKEFDFGSIQIAHSNSVVALATFNIDKLKGERVKNRGVLKGTFSLPVRGGKAKGRFVLNLSSR
jgi:hypothetical protein